MVQYGHKVDRVLEIIKYISLGRATVNLKDPMQRIPECRGATGHGVTIDASINDAWRNIPKGSGAVVKPETLFLVNEQGHLLRFVHNAHGRFTVAGQPVSTQNWNTMKFMGAASLPNGGTALYAVIANGDLYYYTLDGNGKFQNWGTRIGSAWGGFTRFMVARWGWIYVVDGKGNLIIYRHDNNLKFVPLLQGDRQWLGRIQDADLRRHQCAVCRQRGRRAPLLLPRRQLRLETRRSGHRYRLGVQAPEFRRQR